MSEKTVRGTEQRHARPLALDYAERVRVEKRSGYYDEDQGLWVIEDETGEMPLIGTRKVTVDETFTKVQAEATDQAQPRRGANNDAGHNNSRSIERASLGETKTGVPSDPTDPPRPRRVASRRRGPEETLTFVDDEGTDESQPRRSRR